jgi:hypothetical protein
MGLITVGAYGPKLMVIGLNPVQVCPPGFYQSGVWLKNAFLPHGFGDIIWLGADATVVDGMPMPSDSIGILLPNDGGFSVNQSSVFPVYPLSPGESVYIASGKEIWAVTNNGNALLSIDPDTQPIQPPENLYFTTQTGGQLGVIAGTSPFPVYLDPNGQGGGSDSVTVETVSTSINPFAAFIKAVLWSSPSDASGDVWVAISTSGGAQPTAVIGQGMKIPAGGSVFDDQTDYNLCSVSGISAGGSAVTLGRQIWSLH